MSKRNFEKEIGKKDRKVRKVVVTDDCIGAAPCVAVAPEAFDLNREGKAYVKESWDKESDDKLITAAQSCPVQAIILYDEKDKQIVP